MSKSVKQISEELHISKQAVYQRINAITGFRDKYTKRVGNHLEISDIGVGMIINYIKDSHQDFKQPFDEMDSVLIEQIKTKDKQIEVKDKQILNLQQALDQQQKLELNAVNEIKQLRSKMKRLNINPDADDDIEVSEYKKDDDSSKTDSTDSSSEIKDNNEKQPFWKFWKRN